jgi:hypothetical protein
MRRSTLALSCAALIVVVACGGDSTEQSSGGQIESGEDVQAFFDAVMPTLLATFSELADQLTFAEAALSVASKQGGPATADCPDGGIVTFDAITSQATLADCQAQGVSLSGTLATFVTPFAPNSYQGSFNGALAVGGAFVGELQVNQATAQWMNPVTEETTFWEATVTVGENTYIVSSEGLPPDPSDGDCGSCVGVNAAPEGFPSNRALECSGPPVDFGCTCSTESGETLTFYLSGAGCIY